MLDHWKDLILSGLSTGTKNSNRFENLKYSMYSSSWTCVNSLMATWYIYLHPTFDLFVLWEYFAAIRQVCNVFTAFTYLCVCLSVHKLYHCLFCKTSYHYTGDMEGYEIFSNARNLYKDGSLFNKGFLEMIEIRWEQMSLVLRSRSGERSRRVFSVWGISWRALPLIQIYILYHSRLLTFLSLSPFFKNGGDGKKYDAV